MTIAYLWAWLLTTASGAFLSLALSAPHRPGRIATALGYGVALGMLGAAAFTALSARAGTTFTRGCMPPHGWGLPGRWLGALHFTGNIARLRLQQSLLKKWNIGKVLLSA